MGKFYYLSSAVITTLISANCFAGNSFDLSKLIQPKVSRFIERAEASLQEGRYAEAIAVSDFVMLAGTITVKVDFAGVPPEEKLESKRAIQEALELWAPVLDNQTLFVIVESGPAQVRIKFEDTVKHLGQDVAGVAVWSRNFYDWGNGQYSGRVSSDISLRRLTRSGEKMPFEAIRHTACHEIGHVLGLWDSPRIGDVMGPMRIDRPAAAPSADEIGVLRDLRLRAIHVSQASLLAVQMRNYLSLSVR